MSPPMKPAFTPNPQPLLRALCAVLAILGLAGPPSPANAEEPLGRLFFTPERRHNLDRQRQLNIQDRQEIPVDPSLTINGVVSRNTGKRTVWINGVAQNENDPPSEITVTPNRKAPGTVVVKAAEAPPANARVGDTVNRNTGETTDLLGDGKVTVRNAPTTRPATPQ